MILWKVSHFVVEKKWKNSSGNLTSVTNTNFEFSQTMLKGFLADIFKTKSSGHFMWIIVDTKSAEIWVSKGEFYVVGKDQWILVDNQRVNFL